MTAAIINQAGWQAFLKLAFGKRNERTVLTENSHCGPLRVQRPFYPEGDVCHACILHPPGGVVGGDTLNLDLTVQPGAHGLVTTPGATKFYRSGGREAVQKQNLLINGGCLEWFPQDSIVFPGADAKITTSISLDGTARFIGWEIICLGLPTQDKKFTSGSLLSRLSLSRNNRPLFLDLLRISSAADLVKTVGLRGFPVMATLIATNSDMDRLNEVRELEQQSKNCLSAATLMGELLVFRYLGFSTFAARELFQEVWTRLRPALLQCAACPPRIWTT